jgi:hypothetical protein
MKTKKKTTKAKKLARPKQAHAVRSKAARAHIAEGTRLFALAGRPTKAQFIKVYGPNGPRMTWINVRRREWTPSTSKRLG